MPRSLSDGPNQIMCITYSGEIKLARCVSNGHNQFVYFNYPRKTKGRTNHGDRISSLPDDILVHILCLLKDLREATRTSVLSKKWRNLWSNVPNYDFSSSETISYDRLYRSSRFSDEVDKFARCITKAVISSRASSINRFEVLGEVNGRYNGYIHAWVMFAMRKSVRELKLDFSGFMGIRPRVLASLGSLWCYAHCPSVHTLVSLSLVAVRINSDFLESVLFNFTNLEHLCMKKVYCGHYNYKVVGSLLKLRHLEISYCQEFGELEISARNLTSLVYYGFHRDDVKFTHVPLLNDASFGAQYSARVIRNLGLISGFSSQLSRLTIVTYCDKIIQKPIEVPNQFGSLKQLELIIYAYPNENLLLFINFIDACPLLHKLKLQRILPFLDLKSELKKWKWKECRDEAGFVAIKQHHCLNMFEMVGFLGVDVDFKLILLLAQFAIALEKVILDPNQRYDDGKLKMNNPLDLIEIGRKEAELLRNHLPPIVELKVL